MGFSGQVRLLKMQHMQTRVGLSPSAPQLQPQSAAVPMGWFLQYTCKNFLLLLLMPWAEGSSLSQKLSVILGQGQLYKKENYLRQQLPAGNCINGFLRDNTQYSGLLLKQVFPMHKPSTPCKQSEHIPQKSCYY